MDNDIYNTGEEVILSHVNQLLLKKPADCNKKYEAASNFIQFERHGYEDGPLYKLHLGDSRFAALERGNSCWLSTLKYLRSVYTCVNN